MWEKMVMLPCSSVFQELVKPHWALLETVLWLEMMSMFGLIKEFLIWKVDVTPNVWTWAKKNNLRSTMQLNLEQYCKMLPSKSRPKTSTSLIFISLKIPELAILLNLFQMLRFLLTPDMPKILFSWHVTLSLYSHLFPSSQLLKLCTISILDILLRLQELKSESKIQFLLSLHVLEKLSCPSNLKSMLICWREKLKNMELTFGLLTLDGPAANMELERYFDLLF